MEGEIVVQPGLCIEHEHQEKGGSILDEKSEVDLGTSNKLFEEEKVQLPMLNATA